MNRLVREAGYKNVLDLACGFSPRGLDLTKEGYRYTGGDLQGVIPEIKPIVKKLAGDKADMVNFFIVDVTDYNSIKAAADSLPEGGITIITEGLMPYLTVVEKQTVFENFRRLIDERGGCYITPDFNSNEIALAISRAMIDEDGMKAVMNTMKQFAEKGDSNLARDMAKTPEQICELMKKCGLEMSSHPFLTEDMQIKSFSMLDSGKLPSVKEAYKLGKIYKAVKLAGNASVSSSNIGEGFEFKHEIDGDKLKLKLSGRLDSITSPKLLDEFKKLSAGKTFSSVEIESGNLKYISSAGLRVLLIMFKATANKSLVIKSPNAVVSDVLTVTGYDDIFTVN